MLPSRYHKVLNDLTENRTRTLLIVLSIAVGLFAVGTIVSARAILSTEMERSYAAINPSSGIIRTVEPFDEAFVRSVAAVEGVAAVDARRALEVRARVDGGEWRNLRIFAVEDYGAVSVDKIHPERGAWPPPDREILIERSAMPVLGGEVGETLFIELPDERTRQLPIAGLTHDLRQVPAQLDNTPYGYVSFETLRWLGLPHGYNELHVVAEGANETDAQEVVNAVKEKAEDAGYTIPVSLSAEPGVVPLDDILQAVLLLMGALGIFSLALSAFLIVNTVTALLTQQRRQIGAMKAIGARSLQLVGMYLLMVSIYGALALVIAVPAGVAGSRALSRFLAALFNFDLAGVQTPTAVFALQVAVGLLVPVLASLVPFLSTLKVAAAEAMRDVGLGRGRFGTGLVDRLLSGGRLWFTRTLLHRSLLLSLRNTFRNKGRLALTLATLILAGAAFVSVFSVRKSLAVTVEGLMQWWNFEVAITFQHPHREERIRQKAGEVAGVVATDVWLQLPARRVRPDGSESGNIYLFAPRAASELIVAPVIYEGRWLLPADENAVVITGYMAKEEGGLSVGEELVLKIDGKEHAFRIVGISMGAIAPMAYVNYPYVAEITGNVGQATTVLVRVRDEGLAGVTEAGARLDRHFRELGLRPTVVQTVAEEREKAAASFDVIVSLLLIMALLLAVVGGLGLMGTMGINVLERTREIGVLRAIGAPDAGVAQVFIVEGIAIGAFSWLLSALLALPLTRLIGEAVGLLILGTPLTYAYSTEGLFSWLALVVALSGVASFLPARRASRLTVREVLAYE
jgi:putative ABC transport system permease protein